MTEQNTPQKKPYIDYTELYIDPVARKVELMEQAEADTTKQPAKKTAASQWTDYTELYIDPVARQAELMEEAEKTVRHVHTTVEEASEGRVSIRVFFRRGDDMRSVIIDLGIDWNDGGRSEQPYRAHISSATSNMAGD